MRHPSPRSFQRLLGRPRRAALGGVVLLGLAAPLLASPPGAPASASVAEREVTAWTLAGPSKVSLADPLQLFAVPPEGDDISRHTFAWDLDGDGTFERDTGTSATVLHGFTVGGQRTVSVQVSGGTNPIVASRTIRVVRPQVAGVEMDPPTPIQGKPLTLRVISKGGDGGGNSGFAWRMTGVERRGGGVLLRPVTTARPGVGGLGQVVLPSGGLDDVTTSPKTVFTMPAGKKWGNESLALSVGVLRADGSVVTIHRSVGLRKAAEAYAKDPYAGKGTIDCLDPKKGVPDLPCASMTVGTVVSGVPAELTDSTPDLQACVKDGQVNHLTPDGIDEHVSLPLPPEEIFFSSITTEPVLQGRAAPRPDNCKIVEAKTISWDFGDGVKAGGEKYVAHTWNTSGVKQVTLTVKVPYFIEDKGVLDIAKDPHFFKAKITVPVTVYKPKCGPVTVNGVAVRATGPNGVTGCFAERPSLDGTHSVYEPLDGLGVSVGGLAVTGSPVVDPTLGTLSVQAPDVIIATVPAIASPGQTRRPVLGPLQTLVIPPAQLDPAIGTAVSTLQAKPYTAADVPDPVARRYNGLKVTAAQVALVPGGNAYAKLFLEVPSPMNNGTPVAVLDVNGAPTAARPESGDAARALPDGTDFQVDLTGLNLGAFDVKKGYLEHRVDTKDWRASLLMGVAGLGELDATYLPPPAAGTPAPSQCAESTGPSGLELGGDGSFHFAGAALKNANIPIGPLNITCVAVSGQSNPFVMNGRVTADLAALPLSVNACFATAVLKQGQHAAGCDGAYDSPDDSVWFRAKGTARLFNFLDLGSAYFESRLGASYKSIKFGGGFRYDASIFSLGANVDGTVVLEPDPAFDLIGQADLCADLWIDDVCFTVQAGVSSRGFGACASIGGFVYDWDHGLDVFFASCDLRSKLAVDTVVARGAHRAPAAGITVGKNQARVAFVVKDTSSGGAPTVQLTRPDGTTINDRGDEPFGTDGVQIVHYPESRTTTVTVRKPQFGTWQASPIYVRGARRAGTATTELYTLVPEPTVTGSVVARSNGTRRLAYDATLAPGDKLVLIEGNRGQGYRGLGTLSPKGDSFTIPTGGVAGKRTVTVIVERNGIPYKTIQLDTYQAPGLPDLGVPDKLATAVKGSDLHVSWAPVAQAKEYVVTARFADGRTTSRRVTSTSSVFRGVGGLSGGTVSVRALGAVGRDGDAGKRSVTAPKAVRAGF